MLWIVAVFFFALNAANSLNRMGVSNPGNCSVAFYPKTACVNDGSR